MSSRMDAITRRAVRYWARLRRRRRAANRRAAAYQLTRLDQAAGRLALPDQSLPHTRAALYATRATLETFPWDVIPFAAVVFVGSLRSVGTLGRAANTVADIAAHIHLAFLATLLRGYSHGTQALITAARTNTPVTQGGFAASFVLFTTVFLPWLCIPLVYFPRRMGRGADHRYAINTAIVRALELTAEAKGLPVGRRRRKLRQLDRACRGIERHILKAHRRAGTIPIRSTRRAPAKQHAALVAGILRQQLAVLDTDPDKAFTDLSRLLATIGENYAAGDVSALVDTSVYPDAQPLSTARQVAAETMHIAFALAAATVTAAISSAVLPHLHAIPEQARALVTFGSAAVAALVISGPARFSKVFGFLPGRPQ